MSGNVDTAESYSALVSAAHDSLLRHRGWSITLAVHTVVRDANATKAEGAKDVDSSQVHAALMEELTAQVRNYMAKGRTFDAAVTTVLEPSSRGASELIGILANNQEFRDSVRRLP